VLAVTIFGTSLAIGVSYKDYYKYGYAKFSSWEDFFQFSENQDLAVNYFGTLNEPALLEDFPNQSIYFQERNIKVKLIQIILSQKYIGGLF
jgi:hypothetical protein